MRKFFWITGTLLLIVSAAYVLRDPLRTATNPDPNHTHADFAVWVNGEKLNFSDATYMSGVSTDDTSHDEEGEYHHQFLHLHDEVGNVVHRHKPGLTLEEFFSSIDVSFERSCVVINAIDRRCNPAEATWKMFVNGEERPFDLAYAFEDLDQILITDSSNPEVIQEQLVEMTDDACLYSRTCPQRGEPPAENCISDPTIPCVVPPEDL
jgi:hypothetical protein